MGTCLTAWVGHKQYDRLICTGVMVTANYMHDDNDHDDDGDHHHRNHDHDDKGPKVVC